eukprot:scaffold141773_cov45-Attheya_sp.AAC.1
MANRLVSFLHIMLPRAAPAAARPNSWAAVALWRRFFLQQDEEKVERVVEIIEPMASTRVARPAATQEAREIGKGVLRSHYLARIAEPAGSSTAHHQQPRVVENHRPIDLDIPVQGGESYVTLAQ